MKIHDVSIYGQISHHAESLRRIEAATKPEQWAGLKGIYLLYQDVHDIPVGSTACYVQMEIEDRDDGFVELGHESSKAYLLRYDNCPAIAINGNREAREFEYFLLHELGHHNKGQEEKDADIFALQIMQTYIGGMSLALEHEQPLADACRELGIPAIIIA